MRDHRLTTIVLRCAVVCAGALLLAATAGCPLQPQDTTAKLVLGDRTQLATGAVDPSGGTLEVAETGGPLDGLRITVPDGAVTDGVTFVISQQPIVRHNLGAGASTPIPLIWIENGGAEAASLITVRIPIQSPDGVFAMAYYYDEDTGALEGIPQVAQDAESLTIATTHFSPILVTQEEIDSLLAQNWDTGYKPGVDDWQTANRGSYFAPRGFCSGSAYSSLWYFINEKQLTASTLYNRFENSLGEGMRTEGFPEDDESAIQILTVVQTRVKTCVDPETWNRFGGLPGATDDLKAYCAIVSAMKRSNEPQLLGVATGDSVVGHAVLAYKVHDNKIYVANSNFPGMEATIMFDRANRRFEPYSSVESMVEYLFLNPAADPRDFVQFIAKAYHYDKIHFYGKTAPGEWSKVDRICHRFLLGEIPDSPFPDYNIWAVEKKSSGAERQRWILDRHASRFSTVSQSQVHVELELSLPGGSATRIRWCRFDDPHHTMRDSPIVLEPGDNLIGLLVEGELTTSVRREDGGHASQTPVKLWQWLGWDWITLRWSGEEPVDACTFIRENLNESSWYIRYGVDCDTGEWTSGDAIRAYRRDGTVADHWLGVISGVAWSIDDGGRFKCMTESYPPGTYYVDEADLSEDCSALINGISYTTDNPDDVLSCWDAQRRW